jgi:hypothetical protein
VSNTSTPIIMKVGVPNPVELLFSDDTADFRAASKGGEGVETYLSRNLLAGDQGKVQACLGSAMATRFQAKGLPEEVLIDAIVAAGEDVQFTVTHDGSTVSISFEVVL